MIQKRERADLYDKFRQGAIPSGADFADLIRSQLNLVDDGIDISEEPQDPVCLRAHGENESYLDFATSGGIKKWRVAGRCEDMTKEGLNITADKKNRFYIERETGNIGINTDKPGAKLHIIQTSAVNALRIDDTGGDQTPFIINSSGQVGIGIGSPLAQLHLSHDGSGDVLRVDDRDGDTDPLVIDETGNVGIGYVNPKAKLAVKGGVAIGTDDPHGAELYVDGDIEVTGKVVFSGDDGFQINTPLTSETNEIIILDNVSIRGDRYQAGSYGNLSVAGHTTLGTFSKIEDNQSVLTVNGRIRSGYDPDSGDQQYDLQINDILTVNREPGSLLVTVDGNLAVIGRSALGNNRDNDYIYLNGTVQRDGNLGVIIDDTFTVTKTASLYNVEVGTNLTVSQTSSLYNVVVDNNLSVSQNSSLHDVVVGNNLTVNQTSNLYDLAVGNNLTVSNDSNLNRAFINSLTLQNGIAVTTISSDSTLSGKSNSAIPTEKAVKEYVDNRINAIQIIYA